MVQNWTKGTQYLVQKCNTKGIKVWGAKPVHNGAFPTHAALWYDIIRAKCLVVSQTCYPSQCPCLVQAAPDPDGRGGVLFESHLD